MQLFKIILFSFVSCVSKVNLNDPDHISINTTGITTLRIEITKS